VREVDKSCDMFQKNLKEEEGDKTKTKTKTKMGKSAICEWAGRSGAGVAAGLCRCGRDTRQGDKVCVVLCLVVMVVQMAIFVSLLHV
jgi:hypothetical protein